MKPTINKGGFFCSQSDCTYQPELEARLRSDGAVVHTAGPGMILAAWAEFPGQGLWFNAYGAVAHDVDLTNVAELKNLIGEQDAETCDLGNKIWLLYRKFGVNFIGRLRGSFAFALWDHASQRLLIATDFYGVKPVVYHRGCSGLIAASRIRQLRTTLPSVEINPDAIYHYLFFQAVCSPLTIFREIHKLCPGRALLVENGRIDEFTHYDIRYQPVPQGEEYWRKTIPEAIEAAIATFVPLSDPQKTGCFLSGGTDSSSVAGFYSLLSKSPAKTFSIGFDDPRYNELDYARIAAKHFSTEHHEYMVTPSDVLALLEDLPRIYDEPFGNASVVAAYFCALLARNNGVDVMLGGDGGDEIFGGNERYVQNLVFERYFLLPQIMREELLEPILGVLPSIGIIHKAKRYVRRANIRNPKRFYSYNLLAELDNSEIFQPDFLVRVNRDSFLDLAAQHYEHAAPAHDTDRLLYLDMKFTITDNDLRKVTQMAEAAGVEVRYPLLDRDLVDFASTIPAGLKVRPGKNRYIFKRAMTGFLPEEIIRKKKHGMGLPIARWFRTDRKLSELLKDVLFTGAPFLSAYVKPEYLGKLKASFEVDETPYYGDNLWVYLMLELWLRNVAAHH